MTLLEIGIYLAVGAICAGIAESLLDVHAGCLGSIVIGWLGAFVGTWVARHLSWENPFINAPLVYENVTSVEDARAPDYIFLDIGTPAQKYEYQPVIWGPSYATGISAADRATTILRAVDPASKAADLARPGHVFPLRAKNGGARLNSNLAE